MFFGDLMRTRRYTAPRDRPGFTCGIQPDIDPERVPAELATQYLLHLLDNTNDPDREYNTLVHNIAFQTRTKAKQRFPSPCTANCSSLFLSSWRLLLGPATPVFSQTPPSSARTTLLSTLGNLFRRTSSTGMRLRLKP